MDNVWQRYEREKQAWIRTHPGYTQAQYDAAMRVIADELGI